MLIAKLKPTDYQGRRLLTGTMQNTDVLKNGTPVVLKREGDHYLLNAITGFPRCSDPQQGMLSFVLPEEHD